MSEKSSEYQMIIDADHLQSEYYKDLFRYRELFYFFAWRDLLVRYRHTLLGVIWVILRPLINMAIFAFVFGKIAHMDSSQINYPFFVLVGLLPWQLFASSLIDASNSLINNAPMISKIYFPRMILPFSQTLTNLVDFGISLAILLLLLLTTGYLSHWTILLLPIFIGMAVILCLGTGLWIAAINVRYRDVRVIVPFVIQFGLFISPVGYSSFLVPTVWRYLYFLNPLAGIIEGFRWCCFGVFHPDLIMAITLSCASITLILATGLNYFRKMERILADII
ncbi:MAG: ABC transporter permease [Chlamydiales bacterium]